MAVRDSRSAAVQTAAVQAGLAQALARDADLAGAVGALVAVDPGVSNAQFDRWFAAGGGAGRYHGVVALAYVANVPASQVPTVARQAVTDPPFGLPVQRFSLATRTPQANYCLLRLGLLQLPTSLQAHRAAVAQELASFSNLLDPGYDECAGASAGVLLSSAAADTTVAGPLGQFLALTGDRQASAERAIHLLFGQLTPFFEVRPVYRTARAPTTAAARLTEVAGWTIAILDARPLLAPLVHAQSGLALSLSYQNPAGPPVLLARAGTPAGAGSTRRLVLGGDGRWIAGLSVPAPAGFTPDEQGGLVFVATAAFAVLVFFLVRLLAVARSQALELVDRAAGALQHQARHDALTGLANRSLILEKLDEALQRGRSAQGGVLALLVIDLDGFKDLNDAFGHVVGDELLRAVAERLVRMVGEPGTVGRIGGDEFVVVLDGGRGVDPEQLARSIIGVLALPVRLPSVPGAVSVGASIGVDSGLRASARDLLRDADIALYEAKSNGKGRHAVFRPEMRIAVVNRFDLEAELRAAMRANQLFLVYQPTFDLEAMEVSGVEALLRWRHPTRGIVHPVEFVPVLESSGMIVEVGRWVLAEACRQVRLWHDAGYPVSVAVNVSGRQFEGSDLTADVRSALVRSGLDPRSLVVEITETVLMRDPAAIAKRLHQIKALGARVAIDDFGTGYSSMAYLRQFPVDILKIDRSFVTGMVDSTEGAALVRALVQLGKALGLVTLAEGIEDEIQLHRLRAERCDFGQGYVFARPLEPVDAGRFLAARAARPRAPAAARSEVAGKSSGA